MMSLRPNQLLSQVRSTLGQCFVLPSQFYVFHIHGQDQSFFSVYEKHSQFGIFPNRAPIEHSSKLPFSKSPSCQRMTVKISLKEEQLDLPSWTKILATCVSVDVSKYLDILTLEFSTTMVHLPFDLGVSWCCVRCFPAHPGTLAMTSITFAAVICDADDPCSVNTA